MLRKPKYLQSETGGRERWLISYTDIVTVLLILFIAVAAQSMKARVTPPPPPPPPPPPVEQPHHALLRTSDKLKELGADVRVESRGVVISLPQAILFPSGDDQVMAEALPMIETIAAELREIPNKVALVGHADAIPIHNKRFHNNWELSSARSLSLLTVLSTQFGIAESRLSIQSYGSNNPKNSNDTPDGRAENRRVELLILDEPQQ